MGEVWVSVEGDRLLWIHGGRDGVKVKKNKIGQVMDWPEPVDCTQIRRVLGLCGLYWRFVKNFAAIAAPLSSLLQTEKIWDFDEECKASFQRLKLALVEATNLQFPDPDAMFHVHTDSSNIGIGEVLSQDDNARLGLRQCGLHKSEVDRC